MLELLTVNLTWVSLLLSEAVIRWLPKPFRKGSFGDDMSHTTLTSKSFAMKTGSWSANSCLKAENVLVLGYCISSQPPIIIIVVTATNISTTITVTITTTTPPLLPLSIPPSLWCELNLPQEYVHLTLKDKKHWSFLKLVLFLFKIRVSLIFLHFYLYGKLVFQPKC